MVTFQMIFLTAVGLTVASGAAATAIVLFGDTVGNSAQREVAVRLAQIAIVGATAIIALLGSATSPMM